MTKIGSLFGALLGAGGATAYYNGATEPGTFLNYMLGSPQWGSVQPAAFSRGTSNAEIEQLSKLVERLSREVRSQGGGVTVIHGSQGCRSSAFCRTSAIFTYGGVILVSALGVMYIRGWKLSDFLYVTRASLQKSLSTVNNKNGRAGRVGPPQPSEGYAVGISSRNDSICMTCKLWKGVEGLTQRMQSVKLAIAKQIESVKQRQEDAMKAQDELKDQMEIVGLDVESTRSNVAEVHNDLTKLGGDVQSLTQQQTICSEGIFHLVGVLGDLMQQSNIRSQRLPELNRYLSKAQEQNPGLKGLCLESLPGGRHHGVQASRLLPAASSPSELESVDALYPLRNAQGINKEQLPRKHWGTGFGGFVPGSISRQVSASLSQRP